MAEQNIFTIVFVIVAILTVKDLFSGPTPTQSTSPSPYHSGIPDTDKLGDMASLSHTAGPTIKVLYCHSCGYRQAYEDLARRLKRQFPDYNIIGEYHKPGFVRSQIANLVFLAKIAFFVMIYTRFDPFSYYNMEAPRFWQSIYENKVFAFVMTLLVSSSIESSMMSTGAFEIYLDGALIWSKLQTGRIPTYPDVASAIDLMMNSFKTNKYQSY